MNIILITFEYRSKSDVDCILCPIENVDTIVTFVMEICKLRDDFDDNGQLDARRQSNCPVVVEIIEL